ncbi:unnamed protein product [Acidithrix sp. C25]|nr:unnamed protein product [Acidithrix sp. C25]
MPIDPGPTWGCLENLPTESIYFLSKKFIRDAGGLSQVLRCEIWRRFWSQLVGDEA